MKEKKIMLPTMAEAKRFVDEATKCDFDIDVFYNHVTIDAKSILGVLSLIANTCLQSASFYGMISYIIYGVDRGGRKSWGIIRSPRYAFRCGTWWSL